MSLKIYKWWLLTLLPMFVASVPAWGADNYSNPVLTQDAPDPSVIRADNGYFYLYATGENIYRSKDLTSWTKIGSAFTGVTRPSFIDGVSSYWAPDINKIGDKYVLYFALSKWSETQSAGIGVATSDSPMGPFTIANGDGKLFTSSEIGVDNSIDPFYIEDNGKKYLFWGSYGGGIYAIELSDDGLSVKDGASKTKIAGDAFEGSYVYKRGNYYYYFGSVGTCCEGTSSTYKTVYGRSTSLLGPYTNKTSSLFNSKKQLLYNNYEVLIEGNDNFSGTGHNAEIVEDDNGNTWILYHGYENDNVSKGRQVLLSRVLWTSDGWPYVENSSPSSQSEKPVFTNNQLADGYYYIYNTTWDGGTINIPKRGLYVNNHRLCWDLLETANPAFIFKLESTGTDNQYYVQNLKEGSWYSGVDDYWYRHLFTQTESDRHAFEITPVPVDGETGKYLIRSTYKNNGGDLTNAYLWCWYEKDPDYTTDNKHKWTSLNTRYSTTDASNFPYAWYHPLGQDYLPTQSLATTNGYDASDNYFVIEKVTDADLRTARLLADLRTASDVYDEKSLYTEGSTALITDATSNAETTSHYAKGGQFFSSTLANGSSFANIIDGNTTNNGRIEIKETANSSEKPTFLQVDLGNGKEVAGIKLTIAAPDAFHWAQLLFPTDITLYGSNSAEEALSTTSYLSLSDVKTGSNWVKIGDYNLSADPFMDDNYIIFKASKPYYGTRSQEKYILFPDGQKYRFIRMFVNNDVTNNALNHNFAIGEIQMKELSGATATHGLQNDIDTLRGLIASGNAKVQNNTSAITDDDVTALDTAINNISTRRTVTITSVGYATFVSDVNVTLPEGLEAYIVTAQSATQATLYRIGGKGYVLGKDVQVLLKGDAGTYILPVTESKAESLAGTNLLEGTATENQSKTSGTTYYTLQNQSGRPVFKKYSGTTLKAGYAYLPGSSSGSPAFLNISFADPTGIQSAVNAGTKDIKTYDLEGRQVNNPQKGIYIQGGKKVVIK